MYLMRISREINERAGVERAAVVIATEANKGLLKDIDLLTDEAKQASSNDLTIVVKAVDAVTADAAISRVYEILSRR